MAKGTKWVTKTPRLHCPCGRVIHMEGKGSWRIIVDSEPKGRAAQNSLSLSLTDSDATLPEDEDRED